MRETPVHPARATGYFLHTQTPGPAFQNAQLSLSLGETCEAARLEAAWKQIVAAHDILRSGFSRGPGGDPVQRVHDSQGNPWRLLDWTNVPPAELSERWKTFVAEDLVQPIDASQPPLLRITALALPGGHCHLLVTFPRFLLDEDALFHILCEWLEALEGRPPIADQGEKETPATAGVTEWWTKIFEDAPAPAALKLVPLPPAAGAAREEIVNLLDRETTREIKAFAQKLGVAPRDVILGAWALLLARLGVRREALLLATCPTNAPLLDPSENLLPLRAALDPAATIEKWLKDLSTANKDRAAHAAIALDRALALAKPAAAPADFPVTFAWTHPTLNDRLHDAFPRWINLDARLTTRPLHPLSLRVADGSRYSFHLEFDPAICPPSEAKNLFERFNRTLDAFLADPAQPLSSINILIGTEEENLPRKSRKALPAPDLLVRISAAAAKQPENVAVVGQDEVALPFAELDAHAGALAAYLGRENLFNGWNIAVCLTPTLWLPVAALGVLRAGDTCVPLDPGADPEWLKEKITACDVELIICDSRTAGLFSGVTAKILTIDQQWETIAAGDAADTVFTPAKVAMICHGTPADAAPSEPAASPELLARAADAAIELWGLGPESRIALTAAPGTLAFAEILFAALAAGATLVLPGDAHPPSDVSHLRLSLMQWRDWLSRLPREDAALPEPLRVVCVEAAPVPSRLLAEWEKLAGDQVKTIFFVSPAGFSGLGVHTTQAFPFPYENPVGGAGDGAKAELSDPLGRPLPPHHEGVLKISLRDRAASLSVPAWRDRAGGLHLARPAEDVAAEVLCHLPEVQDALVRKADGKLRAWLILKNGATEVPSEVAAAAKEHLPEALRPQSLQAIAHFPLTPGGAFDAEALRPPPAPVTPAPAPAPARPSAAVPATPSEPPAPAAPPRPAWQPVAPLRVKPETPLLILVHDLEGDSARYAALVRLLSDDDWSIHATTARGLNDPSAVHQTLEEEASDLCRAIRALDGEGPYHLFGHGFGAILAFEVARQLRALGCQVPYLALAGATPPAPPPTNWMRKLGRAFSSVTGKEAPRLAASAVGLAHEAALRNYQAVALDGPAGIILGADQDQAEAGWIELLPEAFIEHMSCASKDMLSEPAVRRLAVILRECADSGPDGE